MHESLFVLIVKWLLTLYSHLIGCVDGYLDCIAYDRVPSKILTYQASDDPVYSRYRAALESTSQEQTLVWHCLGYSCGLV